MSDKDLGSGYREEVAAEVLSNDLARRLYFEQGHVPQAILHGIQVIEIEGVTDYLLSRRSFLPWQSAPSSQGAQEFRALSLRWPGRSATTGHLRQFKCLAINHVALCRKGLGDAIGGGTPESTVRSGTATWAGGIFGVELMVQPRSFGSV